MTSYIFKVLCLALTDRDKMQVSEKKISQNQRAGQENSYLIFIILLQAVTSQVLISCRQHSKEKCALNEKNIFLYAESADFFLP